MKTQKKTYTNADHGHKRGHHTKIDGKRVVITRTKEHEVWHRPETFQERFKRILERVRAACQRPRVRASDPKPNRARKIAPATELSAPPTKAPPEPNSRWWTQQW